MQFQTQVGQILYQKLLKASGDPEEFKREAISFINNYNKHAKERLSKLKQFPPQITKFTSDDTKNLNILLPDYNLGQYIPNKQNLFENLDDIQPKPNTPEFEFLKIMNKIIDGKILNFWKNC